ncbi:MAG: hypothetical protein LBK58_08210, partial [Prevotellaceae bacterium]|nr:hypothetical protein [Prevotellaceae bacterium]
TGVSEKDIASYWNALNRLPYSEWMNEIRRIKTELNLNDWGMYQLTEKLFTVYFPDGTANEQLVFTVFMLNQLGYRAKIGMNRIEVLGTEIEVLGARIEVLGVRIEAEGRL